MATTKKKTYQPRYSSFERKKDDERPLKRLYRSRKDIMLGGVCAGIAEYFMVDPTLIRLLWVLLTLLTGGVPGVLAYFIAWIIIPVETLK